VTLAAQQKASLFDHPSARATGQWVDAAGTAAPDPKPTFPAGNFRIATG
jgi:hypothetical protein